MAPDETPAGPRTYSLDMSRYRSLQFVVLLLMMELLPSPAIAAESRRPVVEVVLQHGVTPPAVGLARRALAEARAADATALVIQVQAGGGVTTAAWDLAREIASAPVPVVVWIGPGSVESGPAGAILLAAAGIAAMAPGATSGFAFPLAAAQPSFSSRTQTLVVDDVVKQAASWQRRHGRDAEWIERAIRSGAVIDAERARAARPPLIDIVAATADELRTGITGRTVITADGQQRALDTLGAPVVAVVPSLLEELAQILAVPTVAFMLFVLGAVAIYLELANPGVGVPGVAGVSLLLVALYGFAQSAVRPLALVLLVAGLVLIGLEHIVLSHGGLTLGGVLLLVAGALLLVDERRAPGLGVAPLAIAGTSMGLVLAAVGLFTLALRSRDRPVATGAAGLIGQIAEVRRPLDPEGMVYVSGALWSAWTDEGPVPAGDLVEVAGIDNLRLYVRRLDKEPSSLSAQG